MGLKFIYRLLVVLGLVMFCLVIGVGQAPFITTWKTDNLGSSCSSCITIPTFSGETYNYEVDWDNDGTYDEFGITGDVTHDFGPIGTYTIAIRGDFPRIYFNFEGDKKKLVKINQWGDIRWTSMEASFSGCTRMSYDANDVPDLSKVNSLKACFLGCHSFNGDIGEWNVSNVEFMNAMFQNAIIFNQYIGDWDVSNVKDMSRMFSYAKSFDKPLNDWDVSKVERMVGMLNRAEVFNQALNNWDVGNVTSMNSMFDRAFLFNQNIGNWNVSNVNTMEKMFSEATSFNQDIGSWDVSNILYMSDMFSESVNFNQDIGGWDVSKLVNARSLFFGATKFNQDISSWDVSKVNDMGLMFAEATDFNQDIGGWDVSRVRRNYSMFRRSKSFDKSLESWNLQSMVTIDNMLDSCGMSCDNYSTTLIGWATNPNTASDLKLGSANLNYGESATELRNSLINDLGWTITGDSFQACTVTTTDINGNQISTYPNPTTQYLTIESEKNYKYTIHDPQGRLLVSGNTVDHIDMGSLFDGMYFLRLMDDEGNIILDEKILKN